MRPPSAILVAVLACSALVARAPSAWSCTCQPRPARATIATSDAVFVGHVLTTESVDGSDVTATIAVAEVYKGEVTATASVTTPAGGNACGVDLIPGARYAFFGKARDGAFRVDGCSTTDDVTVLAGAGYRDPSTRYPPPTIGTSAAVASGGSREPGRTGPIAAAAVLLGVAAAGLAASVRMRRAGRARAAR
jgi:hypothetical protein